MIICPVWQRLKQPGSHIASNAIPAQYKQSKSLHLVVTLKAGEANYESQIRLSPSVYRGLCTIGKPKQICHLDSIWDRV